MNHTSAAATGGAAQRRGGALLAPRTLKVPVGAAALCVLLLLLSAVWFIPSGSGGGSSRGTGDSTPSLAARKGLAAAARPGGDRRRRSSSSSPTTTTSSDDSSESSNNSRKQPASIIVIVPAKADSARRRAWLRREFRRSVALLARQDAQAAARVVFRFVVGTRGLSDADADLTTSEQATHGDLLLLDIIDTNTPDPPPEGVDTATVLKLIGAAEWAATQYTFPWFVRLGDDSFFRVDYFLLHAAAGLARSRLIVGYAEDPLLGWRWPNGAELKRYCSGMGFVMTPDVVRYIVDNQAILYKGYPEDAVVGLWFAGTTIKVQHDLRFHDWDWKRCSADSIIVHKHDYGAVDDDGVMRSCFSEAARQQEQRRQQQEQQQEGQQEGQHEQPLGGQAPRRKRERRRGRMRDGEAGRERQDQQAADEQQGRSGGDSGGGPGGDSGEDVTGE